MSGEGESRRKARCRREMKKEEVERGVNCFSTAEHCRAWRTSVRGAESGMECAGRRISGGCWVAVKGNAGAFSSCSWRRVRGRDCSSALVVCSRWRRVGTSAWRTLTVALSCARLPRREAGGGMDDREAVNGELSRDGGCTTRSAQVRRREVKADCETVNSGWRGGWRSRLDVQGRVRRSVTKRVVNASVGPCRDDATTALTTAVKRATAKGEDGAPGSSGRRRVRRRPRRGKKARDTARESSRRWCWRAELCTAAASSDCVRHFAWSSMLVSAAVTREQRRTSPTVGAEEGGRFVSVSSLLRQSTQR